MLFTGHIVGEFADALADLVRVRDGRRLQRIRKAKWLRQDARIATALGRLKRGERTMVEFLLEAQNSARSLQDQQFHVLTRLEGDETVSDADSSYPAVLPLIEEYDPDDGKKISILIQFRCNLCQGDFMDVYFSTDPFSPSNQSTPSEPDDDDPPVPEPGPSSRALSQPLLLPPITADFTTGVSLPVAEPELHPAVQRSPPSPDVAGEPCKCLW